MDWLVRMSDRIVGHSDAGLRSWTLEDGAAPQPLSEDTWPHWMWVPSGDGSLVNQHTGRGVAVATGKTRDDALPESQRIEHEDAVGRAPGFVAWSGWDDDRQVVVHAEGRRSEVRWTGPGDRASAAAPAVGGGLWLGGDEWVVRLDASGAEQFRAQLAPISLEALAAGPGGDVLAVVAYEGMINLIDVQTQVARWSWPATRNTPAFSPDGRWLLATALYEGGADVLDVQTGCLVAVLPTTGAALWLDAERVAWVGDDGRLRVERVRP